MCTTINAPNKQIVCLWRWFVQNILKEEILAWKKRWKENSQEKSPITKQSWRGEEKLYVLYKRSKMMRKKVVQCPKHSSVTVKINAGSPSLIVEKNILKIKLSHERWYFLLKNIGAWMIDQNIMIFWQDFRRGLNLKWCVYVIALSHILIYIFFPILTFCFLKTSQCMASYFQREKIMIFFVDY